MSVSYLRRTRTCPTAPYRLHFVQPSLSGVNEACIPFARMTYSAQRTKHYNSVHRGSGAAFPAMPMNSRHDLHCRTPEHYLEAQRNLNCLLHTYNMLRGHSALSAETLHKHVSDHLQTTPYTYTHFNQKPLSCAPTKVIALCTACDTTV